MNRRAFLGSVAACALIRGAPARAAPAQETALQIDRDLRVAAEAGFGGAAALAVGGETLLSRGYGLAVREPRTPFTSRTPAQIGSITKTFTAAAICRLAAEGRVDLMQPVVTYLPDAPAPIRELTLDVILTHRAGLPEYCGDDFTRATARQLLGDCLARPLAHPIGESHYSNAGYSLLALIVERVTGEDWESHLRRTIWRPLGMASAGFAYRGRDVRGFAHGYLNERDQGVISERIAALGGADWNLRGNGGVQASAADMMRFLAALVKGSPRFPDATRRLMLAPHSPRAEGVAEGYGLFFRYDVEGRLFRIGHSGSDGTFYSYLTWYPIADAMLYFVGNNGEPAVLPVLRQILRHVGALPAAA
jgi:CubicO group peptidase (beta-lactamase class C family)